MKESVWMEGGKSDQIESPTKRFKIPPLLHWHKSIHSFVENINKSMKEKRL